MKIDKILTIALILAEKKLAISEIISKWKSHSLPMSDFGGGGTQALFTTYFPRSLIIIGNTFLKLKTCQPGTPENVMVTTLANPENSTDDYKARRILSIFIFY